MTLTALWSSADSSVVRLAGPGVFEAAGTGDTVVHAKVAGVTGDAAKTVSVFPGTAPLPTNEIFGSIVEAGKTPATGAIEGAVVEVLNGLVAGRTAVSGAPPPLPPGFFGPFGGPGYYRLLAIPPGTYTVRVLAAGFLSQERSITVPINASPATDFSLARP